MDIEFLIFVVIVIMLLFWFLWFKLSKWTAVRRYKTENDKGFKGEENRRRLIAEGKPDPAKSVIDNARFTESSKHNILSTTDIDDVGKTSTSNGNVGKKFRNPFIRRR